MKIFVSISSYDALIDASIASTLCKTKLSKHKVFSHLSYSKENLDITEFEDYFDSTIFLDCKKFIEENKDLSLYQVPIRQFFSIIASLNEAISKGYDFVIVLNSGSWILDDIKITEIIEKLKNKIFGVRLMKYSNNKRISCDDHFIIINVSELKKHLDINKLNLRDLISFDLKFGGIHNLLNGFYNKFPYDKIYCYSDVSESKDLYNNFSQHMLPINFDTKFKLLHSNRKRKEILSLRHAYLEKYAKNIFDDFINIKIKEWKNINNVKIYFDEDGTFYLRQNFFSKIFLKLKNYLNSKFIKNWGFLEKIND